MESNPTDESATIGDLPNELLVFIFERLKIKDLIRCSLVCKRFKLICKEVKILELIIKSKKIENIKDFWFYTNKQFNHQDAIDVSRFCAYRSTLRFDKLKRLNFKGNKTEYDQMNVNDLTKLEEMKLNIEHPGNVDMELHVDLPNLKIFEIVEQYPDDTLYITAPKLEMLKCETFEVFRLTDPNTIKFLDLDIYNDSINVLKNVQFYQAPYDAIERAIQSDIFSMFPKLRTLSTYGVYHYTLDLYWMADNLIQQKQNPELKIYFESVKVDSTEKIYEFFTHGNPLTFQINNYNSLLENVVCSYCIDYNELMYLAEGELPVNFFKKYSNTRCIRVTEAVENQEHLIMFLRNFDYLSELRLSCDSLDQSFYDRLAELDQLKLLTVKNSSKSLSNYDFLFKLKLLRRFETDSDSPKFFDLALALFNHLKYLRSICFLAKELVTIRRSRPNFYSLRCSCVRHLKLFLDFDGLVRAIGAFDELMSQDSNQHVNTF